MTKKDVKRETPIDHSQPSQSANIALVEDDDSIRELLAINLQNEGFNRRASDDD